MFKSLENNWNLKNPSFSIISLLEGLNLLLNLRWWKVPISTWHATFDYVILITEELQISTFKEALRQ